MATWQGAIPIRVNGNGMIQFQVWDVDLVEDDLIMGGGAFSFEELANACEPVCKTHRGSGGMICLELRRAQQ
jgi:hypothetical protein